MGFKNKCSINLYAVVLTLFVYETVIFVNRKIKRRQIFKLAQQRSKQTGLPLLVVGDPYNGMTSKYSGIDYSCGDLCLDINGCPQCEHKLKMALEDFTDFQSYIVFISCTLEYVNDLPLICKRLEKMNYENLFVVHIEPYSLTNWLYPNFITGEPPNKYIITVAPPFSRKIEYKSIY